MKRRSVVPGTLAAISFLLFNAFSWRKSIFENHLTAFCRHIHSQSYHHKLWLFRAHDMDSFTGCLLFRCFELLLRRSMLLATTPEMVWGGNKYSGLWTCGDRIYEFAQLKVGMRRRRGGGCSVVDSLGALCDADNPQQNFLRICGLSASQCFGAHFFWRTSTINYNCSTTASYEYCFQ